nr:hypothetical protein BgiMline_022394 [Biomphalaria glabrata]
MRSLILLVLVAAIGLAAAQWSESSYNEEVQLPECVTEYLECRTNVVSVLKAIVLRYDASVILQSMKEAGLLQMIDRLAANVVDKVDTIVNDLPIEGVNNLLEGLQGELVSWF